MRIYVSSKGGRGLCVECKAHRHKRVLFIAIGLKINPAAVWLYGSDCAPGKNKHGNTHNLKEFNKEDFKFRKG